MVTASAERNERTGGRESVQAVERALDLLLLIAGAAEPQSARALATRTGLSASTVLRLLTALEQKGLVERDAVTRRYALGAGALALAARRGRGADLTERALPRLRALRDTLGETVSLHVRTGDQHVCVAEIESPREVRRRVEVGRLFPLRQGATGRVFRAFGGTAAAEEDEEQDAELERRFTDGLPRSRRMVRAEGYAASVEEREAGVSGIAAPLLDAGGQVRAVVTVSGPAERFGPERMRAAADALRAAARAISEELGYHPPVA